MRLRQILGVASAISLLTASAQAAVTSVGDAINQVTADSVLLSRWVNDQFKQTIPFNSTAGNGIPAQVKLFGFEVGGEIVATGTKLDNDAFRALPTTVVDTTQIDTYDRLPLPMLLGHAKIGLPWGLDAGVRLGGLPSKSYDHGDTHFEVSNSIFGLDLRKKLIDETAMAPFGLTLGVNYTHAKGHITAATPYSTTVSGVSFNDLVGTTRTDWNTNSAGLQLLANKKVLFMNPYVGLGANKYWGDMDTSVTNVGSVTYAGNTAAVNTNGTTTSKLSSGDMRALLGIEFSFLPFMRLNIGGEIATQNNMAGNIGLRVQFH
jgi:hypothetical protein